MRFVVERTSMAFNNDKQPIKESYKGKCIQSECYMVSTFDEYNKGKYGNFKDEGFNHREMPDGTIMRDFEVDRFLIDVDSLEEIMELVDKYGDIIIRKYDYNYPILEIYDDYREWKIWEKLTH